MSYDITRSKKESKKSCFMCRFSPENILMLACDDSICLQCAYTVLKQSPKRQLNCQQIEFQCKRCNQITYFDRDLIKQIENNVRIQKPKINPIINQYNFNKNQRIIDESFIEKMKKQYLIDDNSNKHSRESISQKKDNLLNKSYNNHMNRQQIEISKNQVKNSNLTLTANKQTNDKVINKIQYNYLDDNSSHLRSKEKFPKQVSSKINQIRVLNNKHSLIQNSQNNSTKCKLHSYYVLIYYCLQCKQIVCSQCLLRGIHQSHKNQSITQLLQQQLPQFINKTSQKLLTQINHIQQLKDSKFHQLNNKIKQITLIKQNALKYFNQLKKNIQKQQQQVIERCQLCLQNLRKQQSKIQTEQQSIQHRLAYHITQIKQLKSSYKQFLQQLSTNNISKNSKSNNNILIEKQLIQQFIKCSTSIEQMFDIQCDNNTNNPLQDNVRREKAKQNNQSKLLNRHIQKSIQSIRQSLMFNNNYITTQTNKNNSKKQHNYNNNYHHYHANFQQQQQTRASLNNNNNKRCQQQLKQYNPPIIMNSYISYLSTDNNNSPGNNNKNIKLKKLSKQQQRSMSISPYKGEQQQSSSLSLAFFNTTKNNTKTINLSKNNKYNQTTNNNDIKRVHKIQKQNIYIQPPYYHNIKQPKSTTTTTNKLISQTSSTLNNISSKKHTTTNQSSKNSSVSKSKHNSITKKKHSKINNQLNIAKFHV